MVPTDPSPRRGIRRLTATATVVVVFAVGGLTGCGPGEVPGPMRPNASPVPESDDELLRAIRPTFSGPDARAAVAVVEGDDVRVAFVGADADTAFEIGSVTKTFTGLLLAEAVERGEVALDDPIGAYLELGDAPAASATFEELATHRSGLPTFPSDPEWMATVEDGFPTADPPRRSARGRSPTRRAVWHARAAAAGREE